MSANLIEDLEERERLKAVGVDEEAVLDDVDTVLEKRGEIKLRYALLTVIDDGDPTLNGEAYSLWHPFEDCANDARLRFVEAVIAKLR